MEKNKSIPLIPLRGLTIFPDMVIHFDAGREKSIMAIEKAMLNSEDIFLAAQKDEKKENPEQDDISSIGTVCRIKQLIKLPGNTLRVLVEGIKKGIIKEFLDNKDYFEVIIEEINEEYSNDDVEIEAHFKMLKKSFINFVKLLGDESNEMPMTIESEENISEFTNMVSGYLPIDYRKKQELLETLDINKRIEKLLVIIENEIKVVKVQRKLAAKVKKSADDSQKEFYLREQLKFIQEELGEDFDESKELNELKEKINSSKMPKIAKEKCLEELRKLKNVSMATSEGNSIRTYLDWVLDIPWGRYTRESLDIEKVEKILDEEHYGLKDVKERILEYLSVKKISGSSKGPILCLVGPPGVGKTSIASSIAKAINRKYVRMSLGGMSDEAEIRGHRRTYVAAIPGRIIYALKESKSMNPLMLLDEIDKLSSNYKGNPADALLEVLDSEQNKTFRDNFIELPTDLSKVLFITTANSLETIPRPLLDRMEVVEVSGYTYEEKFHIAKEHLIKKIFNQYSLPIDKVNITDEAIKLIIDGYTRESGVRELERKLSSLIRKSMAYILKNKKEEILIDKAMVEELMGKREFTFDKSQNEDKVGVVTGMAWTAYGGDTLPVEAVTMEGNGKLQLTGQLGDVMQESAKTAYSYVRANAKKFGIDEDFYKNKDIHIHAPEGSVPKDGPSAGVTMVTALVSALTGKKVRGNIAMTGEVTLTGQVLPIGGLKEKSLAAYRYGIDTIIIPKENEKDIEDIPDSIKNNIKIILAKQVDEVVKNAIIGVDTHDN
ncbi:MAG: endopeptidase La [Clostridium sp.]|nr:endopeptidase La [Clostridium sp.]